MTLNVTLNPFSAGTSQECQCVGGIFSGSAPGYLGVQLTLTANFTAAYMISITSPNGTEAIVPPVRSGDVLFAETVAFAGFQGLGLWTIKLLDASGNPSFQAARAKVEFRLQACNQILALPACFGNFNRGNDYIATNLALVGTSLSTRSTLLEFDVEVNSACCVPAFFGPGSGGSISRLQLEFDPGPVGLVTADGYSPDNVPVGHPQDSKIGPFWERLLLFLVRPVHLWLQDFQGLQQLDGGASSLSPTVLWPSSTTSSRILIFG